MKKLYRKWLLIIGLSVAKLAQVRAQGAPLPADILEASDLILPHEDSSMDEVRKLLTDEGLIPG